MGLMDYLRLRTSQLQHLAGGGDSDAKKELDRRRRDTPAVLSLAAATYLELRALVKAWRDGDTDVARADAFNLAQRAQDELAARWRTRSRLGWRPEDADVFGPEGLTELPLAPWLVPGPRRCVSWKRPTGSTHYPSQESINRAALNVRAREFYEAAGVPQKRG
ncbi:MAG: hypothetical protein K1Y01_07740 [Vicinamibacteria bacterium]|nr:hypothetical protein [Vicinamibacteria bacterium]